MTLATLFGEEIRRIRQEANLSQEDLAYRAKVHRTYISQLERGLKTPSLEVVFRLCAALNQEPYELIKRMSQKIEEISTPNDQFNPP